MDSVIKSKLQIIEVPGGNVYKYISPEDSCAISEIYFSRVDYGAIKAWKMHTEMTMRLACVYGVIDFVAYDVNFSKLFEIRLNCGDNYQMLVVHPGVWFGFQGVATGTSVLVNASDIPVFHEEAIRIELNEISHDWAI